MWQKYSRVFLAAPLVFLCSAFIVSAQNINISFVSQREPNSSSSISYGDVWAENNIACLGIWLGYSGANYGVGIYDISDPAAPALQSIYTAPSSSNNQFEQGVVRNRIGYFASWSGGGLHIVSLTNAASPVFLSQIGSGGNGFDDIHTLFLERNFVYEASHRATSTGPIVKVIDVSNPFAPVFVRNITTTNTLRVHQITALKKGASTFLYTSGWGNGSVGTPGQTDIWDVSNVGTQPAQWLGKIISGNGSHSSWPTPDGNTLVVCRETSGGDVRLYDIANPAAPVVQAIISPASMGLPSAIPHNPVVVSNLLFLSWYQHGIQIFNIADRTKPVRIGAYDTYPGSVTASFEGNWGVFPDLGLDKLLLSDIQTGFYVLDASAVLTATNNYPPLLVTNPVSLTATQGNSATLACLVTGSSLKYQWRLSSTNISGATNSALIFTNVQPANAGNYTLVTTNFRGSVTSVAATLSVVVPTNLPPTISAQPQHVAVYQEQDASFSVAVVGAAPFAFQWRFNGAAIPDATNNSFMRTNTQPEEVGAYTVVISNTHGSVISSNAFLTLIDSPYINNVQSFAGARSALVSWKTTVAADGQVQYDATSAPSQVQLKSSSAAATFSNSSHIDRTLSTNHTILLTGLAPATRYNFQVVSAAETNHYLSGVYSFTTAGGAITLDNTNAGVTFVNTWTSSRNVATYYGTNYLHAAAVSGSPTHFARFRPMIPVAGKYNVYQWHPSASDRATNAPFTIAYDGGTTTVLVNQRVNGGQWNALASELPFVAGNSGFVQLANNASGISTPPVVIADAVQFVYPEAQDFSIGNIPIWWEKFYFGAQVNASADPDGDGYSTAQEYVLGTSPVDPQQKFTMRVFRSSSNAVVYFQPFLGGRAYTFWRRADLSGAPWEPQTVAMTPDGYGGGMISLSLTNASQNFYRFSTQLTTNSSFSGSFVTPKSRAFSPYATEPICGPNRAYVK